MKVMLQFVFILAMSPLWVTGFFACLIFEALVIGWHMGQDASILLFRKNEIGA